MTGPALRAMPLAALAGLLLAAPARADWTSFGGNPEHQIYTTEKITAPLGILWKYATTTYAGRDGNRGGPVIADGSLYFGSKSQTIAIDAATGELKWRMPEADANDPSIPQVTATPAVNGDILYVPASDGTLTAHQTADGAQLWAFKTGGPIHSSPVMNEGNVVFGSNDDFLYCINGRSGELVWKSNDRGKDYRLTDDVVGSPVVYNGVIYVNSSDMKVWAFQADNGRLLWQQRLTGPTADTSPVALNGRIYMAAGTSMYQFRLRGGNYRAYPLQQYIANEITTTPIITEKNWFFGDRSGNFYAFDVNGKPALNDQDQPWKVKLEGKPVGAPVMTADTIYVSTDKGFIYGLNIEKGQITWTYRSEPPKGIDPLYSYYAIRAPLAVSDGRLYVLGDDGTLNCMTPSAPDDEGPIVTAPRPTAGTVTNGFPPLYMSCYLWDEGTGINPDTIEVFLDGIPIQPDALPYYERTSAQRKGWVYDPLKRLLRFETQKAPEGKVETPLTQGPHKVTVQAADWRGNFNSLEWTFIVDNAIPRGAQAVKPTSGRRPGQPGATQPGGMGPGGYGGSDTGPGGMMGGPGGLQGGPGVRQGGRYGGYQFQNRGRGGYGFQGQGGMGGGLGGRGGMGGGSMGGRGGMRGGG